jgi:hypothetical protein
MWLYKVQVGAFGGIWTRDHYFTKATVIDEKEFVFCIKAYMAKTRLSIVSDKLW